MSTAVSTSEIIHSLGELSRDDVAIAGGKGANLGELTCAGFPVPPGFVVLARAYADFVDGGGLRARIVDRLEGLDVDDTAALGAASADVRGLIESEPLREPIRRVIADAYDALGDRVAVAVRSSATAEDTASASFAGMNETFLNVRGTDDVLDAVRRCWSSLFGARTIFYRAKRGLGQAEMDIAVVVQQQLAATRAGVMFTIDPASGRTDRLVIEGSFGLGEAVVSGTVSPDRYVVDKETDAIVARDVRQKEVAVEPAEDDSGVTARALDADEAGAAVLLDSEVVRLADLGRAIEAHYGAPQDTEWAFDRQCKLWVVQSRPVTTLPSPEPTGSGAEGPVLVRGLGAAPGVAAGAVRIVDSLEQAQTLADGEVLVAHMTAPDWVPLMRRAAAIVTDSGGMTCHAAIVSRELGIPCVVGASDATSTLEPGAMVTVDAGRGVVLAGSAARAASEHPQSLVSPPVAAPVTGTRLLVNLSEPSQVTRAAALPVDGVGLLRAELMILEALDGAHPRTLMAEGRADELVAGLADALTTFAAGFSPRPVTYRTIDFRTNEFRGLRGGEEFEPIEANPMIGYRGALRYTREPELLRLELDAVARVYDAGFRNLHVMLPFVRTVRELERCRRTIAESGLLDRPGFELWVMAEVPSVLFNLDRFAELDVTGISIGSNDLTQLLLGADRDSELVAEVFDERDPAVVEYLRQLIPRARALGLRTSICGQAPSVHPEYADILVDAGIDAVSVNLDAVDSARRLIAAAEQRRLLAATHGNHSLPGGRDL